MDRRTPARDWQKQILLWQDVCRSAAQIESGAARTTTGKAGVRAKANSEGLPELLVRRGACWCAQIEYTRALSTALEESHHPGVRPNPVAEAQSRSGAGILE